MSEELIKKIEKLIEQNKGDPGRLEHILNSTKQGKSLFSSDQKYLDDLITTYLSTETKLDKESPVEKEEPTIAHKEKHDDVDELRKKISDLEEKVEKKTTKPPKNIIRNVAIVLVVVVVILITVNYLTVPYPGVPKFIDSMTCEIFIMENDLPLGIGEYDQECLDFKSLPLSEQYAWCDANPGKC